MLSRILCRPEDGTLVVLKATFLLNYSTGQNVLSAFDVQVTVHRDKFL